MAISEEDHKRLRSALPLLGVEAAAGAGKTHAACDFAFESVGAIKPYQEVLFLSHTNAARDVFRRRITRDGQSTRGVGLKTLDSFCLELLGPYARLWDLPVPLRPPTPMPRGWFVIARHKAAILLRKKREIAQAVAARYPIVIADEHQDASVDHHSILVSLAGAGAKVRMFGDALQAILTFDETIPGWDQLMAGIPIISLSGVWRWKDEPQLGAWITEARLQLRAGRQVSLARTPDSVRVIVVDGTAIQAWSRNSTILTFLREMRSMSSFAVLGRRNDHVREIARVGELGLLVNEGSDQSAVEEVVAEVAAAHGNPLVVAKSLVDFMIGCGQLDEASATHIRTLSGSRTNECLAEIVDTIKGEPNISGLVVGTRLARRNASVIKWIVVHPVAVQSVAGLPSNVLVDDVRDLLFQAQRAAAESVVPLRCASTIHKAKGREFDNVVIPSLDAGTFGPSVEDRQLLYVALSRARRTLTLIVPKGNPSPLVTL